MKIYDIGFRPKTLKVARNNTSLTVGEETNVAIPIRIDFKNGTIVLDRFLTFSNSSTTKVQVEWGSKTISREYQDRNREGIFFVEEVEAIAICSVTRNCLFFERSFLCVMWECELRTMSVVYGIE